MRHHFINCPIRVILKLILPVGDVVIKSLRNITNLFCIMMNFDIKKYILHSQNSVITEINIKVQQKFTLVKLVPDNIYIIKCPNIWL